MLWGGLLLSGVRPVVAIHLVPAGNLRKKPHNLKKRKPLAVAVKSQAQRLLAVVEVPGAKFLAAVDLLAVNPTYFSFRKKKSKQKKTKVNVKLFYSAQR